MIALRTATQTPRQRSHLNRAPLMTSSSNSLLLAAERAVDLGGELIRRGRSHYGATIEKGDRDYATEVDLGVERGIRAVLREADPGIAFRPGRR